MGKNMATKIKMDKSIKARVLADITIDGIKYKAGCVAEFNELTQQLQEAGVIDTSLEAVAYAEIEVN